MRRKKKYVADVIFNYPLESQTSDTIIFHDEALLPHWREVALALEINSEKLKKSLPSEGGGNSMLELFDVLSVAEKEDMMKNLPRICGVMGEEEEILALSL